MGVCSTSEVHNILNSARDLIFWPETVSLLDVMWPRNSQWEHALLRKISSFITNCFLSWHLTRVPEVFLGSTTETFCGQPTCLRPKPLSNRKPQERSFFGDLANTCFEIFFKIHKLAYFLPSVVQGNESATPNKICLWVAVNLLFFQTPNGKLSLASFESHCYNISYYFSNIPFHRKLRFFVCIKSYKTVPKQVK